MVPIEINRIQHVGLPVTSLATSRTFYEGLGFVSVMESTFPHPDGTGHVAMLQRGEIMMELYESPAPALQEVLDRRDGHIDHVAFDVADINVTFAALKSGGYQVIEPAPVTLPFWKRGCRYFNILGPDGERLEFNQIL